MKEHHDAEKRAVTEAALRLAHREKVLRARDYLHVGERGA